MANYSQKGEYRPLACVSKHPGCKVGTDAICVPCQDQYLDNIRDLLAKQGSMIGKFHQLRFNDATANKKTVQTSGGLRPMGGGYCAGVALDWVRRVLLSAENRDQAYLNYHYEGIVEGKQSNLGGHTPQDAKARGTKTLNRMAKAYALEPDNRWQPDKAKKETIVQGLWDQNMQKIEASRGLGKKKPFTDITLTASDRTEYGSADQWRAALLGGSSGGGLVAPGHAARLDFSPSGGQGAGHAVAVWRRRENTAQTDSYYFFEPGLGVFSFSATGLDSALSILFAYQNGDVPVNDDTVSPEGAVVAFYVFKAGMGAVETGQPQVQTTVKQPVQSQQTTGQPSVQPFVQPFVQPSPQITPQPTPKPTASLYGGNAQQGLVSPGNTRPAPQTVQLPSQPKPLVQPTASTGNSKQDFTNWLTSQFVDKYNGVGGGWVQLSEQQKTQVESVLLTQIKGIDKNSVVQQRLVKGRLAGPNRPPYAILKSHLDEAILKLGQ